MSSSYRLGLAILGLLDIASAAAPACTPGQWVNLTSIPSARQEHGTTAIGNTTIAILGGLATIGNETEATTTDLFQLYDIESDTWTTASPAPYAVNHPNVASVDGKLYLLGGLYAFDPTPFGTPIEWAAVGDSYVYDPETDTWAAIRSIPNGTERGSAIVGVHNEMIYLAGGMTILANGQDAVDSVISYNTTSDLWQRLDMEAAELPESRQHGTGAVIGDTFYVIGGRRYSQTNVRDTVFALDLTNTTSGWQITTPMPVARGGLDGGVVGSKFYAFGGEGNPDSLTGVYNQSQVFDTTSQSWTELGVMQVPRHGTQAAGVGDRVYIPGGGLQQDGKSVTVNGVTTSQNPTNHFDAYCA
ncbi:galactose oxidase [Thozetella sp. PMI_491]|nr:galactose oxidase [Thozetella sp. PMI_491]